MAVSVMARSKHEVIERIERQAEQSGASANCVVAKGTVIEGHFKSAQNIRMDGTLVGDVDCEKKFVLGDSGRIEGKLKASSAVIMGHIVGDVRVEGFLQLNSTAHIEGDITAKKMTVEEGARYQGACKIG